MKTAEIAILTFTTMILICGCTATADVVVKGPDGKLLVNVTVSQSGQLQYELKRRGRTIIENSPLGVTVEGEALGRNVSLGKTKRSVFNESYPWRGVHSPAVNKYRAAKIDVHHAPSGTDYTLEIRLFNDGLGYRYIIPGDGTRTVAGEDTAFKLPAGSRVWTQTNTNNYEDQYKSYTLENLPIDKHAGPPVVVELPRNFGYAAITEAALFSYSGMTLLPAADSPGKLNAAFQDDKTWQLQGQITTPWRVVIATADLNGLVNTDIIHNLNDPPSAELADADWIRPGRGFWHWWSGRIGNWDSVAFDRQHAWIDNAEAFGFEYYLVDAGWEFTWKKPGKDKWYLLKELTRYAADKGVGVWVWKRWRTGSTEGIEMVGLDDPAVRRDFFQKCKDAGVAGIKIDFMDSESKDRIDFYTNVLKDAADYKLMINFHGANKPTGESRTWPNEMTREGIKGLEYNKWSALPPDHYATLPFTRFLAGHGDFTPCTFNSAMLKGTTFALQLASAVCFTSPVMHYADKPELYLRSPAGDVMKAIPSTWDETRVLKDSKIGDLAVLARRKGKTWFVGIINGAGKRTYELDLSFLGAGKYQAVQLEDDPDRPDALMRSKKTLSAGQVISVDMNAGGGFVAMFSPE